jgi:hypothetical protein
MAKSLFKVAHVERGMEALWREFWMEKEPSKKARKAHAEGHLGRVEHVEASNLNEAIAKVQRMYPASSVMHQGSGRLGGL